MLVLFGLRLEPLQQFDRVERLRVADDLVLDVTRALQWLTLEMELELFPALREPYLGNSLHFIAALEVTEAMAPFINIRELSGYPSSCIIGPQVSLTNLKSWLVVKVQGTW